MLYRSIIVASLLSIGPAGFIVPAALSAQTETTEAEAPAVPNAVRAMLELAATREDPAEFLSVLELARQANPAMATELNMLATTLRPDLADNWQTQEALPAPETVVVTPDPVPEEVAEAEPEEGLFNLDAWNGELNLGLTITTGDTEETAVAGGFEIKQIIGEVWDHTLRIDGDYSNRQGETVRERVAGEYQLYYRNWDRLYLFNFFSPEYDRFSGFDYRVIDSLGVGYTVLKGDAFNWHLEGGPGIRIQRFDETNETQTEFLVRLSSDFEWNINDKVTLGNRTGFLAGTERLTLNNTLFLESKLRENLAARISFRLDYDNDVPETTSELDTQTKASIVYSF